MLRLRAGCGDIYASAAFLEKDPVRLHIGLRFSGSGIEVSLWDHFCHLEVTSSPANDNESSQSSTACGFAERPLPGELPQAATLLRLFCVLLLPMHEYMTEI